MRSLPKQYFQRTASLYRSLEESLSQKRLDKLKAIQEKLGITFNSQLILNKALTHKSYLQSRRKAKSTLYNQRLEFLGDSVLSVIISEYLFCHYPFLDEGELSKMRAAIVSKKVLVKLAKRHSLAGYILMGKGEANSESLNSDSILGDAIESLIGAYFIDHGYTDCSSFVLPFFAPEIDELLQTGRIINYKSLLQECAQKKFRSTPEYKVDKTEGPSHRTVFYVSVYIDEERMGEGSGFSKKEAQIKCANNALEKYFKQVLKNGK